MEASNQVLSYEKWPLWVKFFTALQWNYISTNYLLNSLIIVSTSQLVVTFVGDQFLGILNSFAMIILGFQLKASLWIDHHSDHSFKPGWGFKRVVLNILVLILLIVLVALLDVSVR